MPTSESFSLENVVSVIGYTIEGTGVLIIVVGFLLASLAAVKRYLTREQGDLHQQYRRSLAKSMMLGLEFLVAGDIIRTVVIAHTIQDVLALGLIVLIRTVLVFTIHLEVEGRWPWQKEAE